MNENKALRVNGKQLICQAFAPDGYSDRAPSNVVSNAGMSGSEGIFQTHSAALDAMWLTVRDPGDHNTITFAFPHIVQLGYMYVWNYNQPYYTGPGLRDVEIWSSCDGEHWELFKGPGYPYRFARAEGKPGQKATNLDDGKNTPIDFQGLSARYIKLVPDVRLGVGNWGEFNEHQHRYGLSQVRFYAYKPDAAVGAVLAAKVIHPVEAAVLASGYGLSASGDPKAVHSNSKETMWVSELKPIHPYVVFDLDGTYPVGQMRVWNYNESEQVGAGLRDVEIAYSIDGVNWTELRGKGYPYRFEKATGKDNQPATDLVKGGIVDFDGALARFIKLEPKGSSGLGTWGGYNGWETRFGLSKVQFYAAPGYCIEPAREYDGLLSRFSGWSGADGIFMVPLDGIERKRAADENTVKTLAVFSDTFVGESDPVTKFRRSYEAVNNSMALVSGCDPYEGMQFDFYDMRDKNGIPCGIIPNPADKSFFYWLQDCVVINNVLYAFTDNIVEDLSGMEGFQFRLIGVDRVSFAMTPEGPDLDSLSIVPTPLYTPKMYFGCAILPNHHEACLAGADGYIYVYGLYEAVKSDKQLVVARIRADQFADMSEFTFYDGKDWSSHIEDAAPICEEAGSEMSVSPITTGEYAGKYLFVYTSQKKKDVVVCRIGDTPWGPVGEAKELFVMDTPEDFSSRGERKVYYYNAKGHYHISREGELIITNNVNTMDYESNLKNVDIYRPRFHRLHRIE